MCGQKGLTKDYMVEVQRSLQSPFSCILFYSICKMTKTVSMIPQVAIGSENPAIKKFRTFNSYVTIKLITKLSAENLA
jgi:hypothetical protein